MLKVRSLPTAEPPEFEATIRKWYTVARFRPETAIDTFCAVVAEPAPCEDVFEP